MCNVWVGAPLHYLPPSTSLGEKITGSDSQASPEHPPHVPLPALSCTSTCTACHPQQIKAREKQFNDPWLWQESLPSADEHEQAIKFPKQKRPDSLFLVPTSHHHKSRNEVKAYLELGELGDEWGPPPHTATCQV